MSATVSSSFIAIRPKVSRMSLAEANGSGLPLGPSRVHVDQAHLHGAERTGELPVAAVALVAEPGVLRPPEHLLGLPDVLTPEAEAERREAHRLHGDVAGEDEQVGPGELAPVLLLDRPEQAARSASLRSTAGPTTRTSTRRAACSVRSSRSTGASSPGPTCSSSPATSPWSRWACLLYTSPSPRDRTRSRMPSSA